MEDGNTAIQCCQSPRVAPKYSLFTFQVSGELIVVVRVVVFSFFRPCDKPEQSVRFIADPGGKIEPAIEKEERPQTVKGERLAPTIIQRTKRSARMDIEGVDRAVSEIPDQQNFVTKIPKLMRYLC